MLLYKLSGYKPGYLVQEIKDEEIYSYQLLSPSSACSPGVVYLANAAALAAGDAAAYKAAPVLLIEDAPHAPLGLENVATLPAETSLTELAAAVSALLAAESRTRFDMQRLIGEYNAGRGLQSLVDMATGILHNPMIVVDVSYKILAMSSEDFGDREDLTRQKDLGYLLTENVDDLKRDNIYAKSREHRMPFYNVSSTEGKKTGWMTAPLYLNSIEVGHIDVMEKNQPFTQNDYELVHFFAELISLELQKNDFFKSNRGFMHSFFLSELLDGQIPDANIVNLRLKHLNWEPSGNLYVMLVTDNHPGMVEGKTKIISQQIHSMLPSSRWAIYNGSLVFLLSQPDDSTAFMQPDGDLYSYLKANDLTASISGRFGDLLRTARYYHQARQAAALGKRLAGDGPVYYYPDYLFQHIGTVLAQQYDLSEFLHPVVVDILQYDREHKSNLLGTLEQHLLYGDNPTLVAANLFIHRNTLFYRLGKIRDLFNVDLGNGDERLKILLSLKLLQLME